MKRTQRLYSKSVPSKSVGTSNHYIKNSSSTDKRAAPGQSKPCVPKRFYFSLFFFPFPVLYPFPLLLSSFLFQIFFSLSLSLFFISTLNTF
ncbi:hypothetical protein K492DRAFT_16464 [Lichtheimia hyalospora FSU 10163]|nr:hypothetical protein K492DRAFT_16464 [Lichtheimia hyalospora FSU 10163]